LELIYDLEFGNWSLIFKLGGFMSNYGISKEVNLTYQQAIEKVKEELKKEGFGVLTEIDVKETLKKKLNVDYDKYIILGACNPNLAYKTLSAEKEIGLLLPCNVIVYEDKGKVIVSAIDAEAMFVVVQRDDLQETIKTVKEKLSKVIANM